MNYKDLMGRWLRKGKAERTYAKRTNYPVRDWLIGLALFAAIVLLGGGYSAHVFITYRDVAALKSAEATTLEKTVYNANTVAEALAIFRAKKTAFDALTISPFPVAPAIEEESKTASTSASQQDEPVHLE
jgi:hypothetical protein